MALKVETPERTCTATLSQAWLEAIERRYGKATREEAEQRWNDALKERKG